MQQLDPKLELPRAPRPLIESNPEAEPYPVQALGGILGLGAGHPRPCGLISRQAQRINPAEPDSASGATLEAELSAPRLITTDPTTSPKGSRNLLAPNESYKDFMQSVVRPARDLLHE